MTTNLHILRCALHGTVSVSVKAVYQELSLGKVKQMELQSMEHVDQRQLCCAPRQPVQIDGRDELLPAKARPNPKAHTSWCLPCDRIVRLNGTTQY